jgi:hypothetical protein
MAAEESELSDVLELIPTERESLVLVYQLRFVVYASGRWAGIVNDIGGHGWRLLRTMELLYEMFTLDEIQFFGNGVRELEEERLAELRASGTENGLHVARERLASLAR